MKKALITDIPRQDGSYLAGLLLEKGYEVRGIKRRASSFNTQRIDHFYMDLHENNVRFKLYYGDLTDSTNVIRIIQEVQPDEIYNLGAMSHVKVSFDSPEYVANVVEGINNLSYQLNIGKTVVKADPEYFRPTDVDLIIGTPTKANFQLGWQPKYDLQGLVEEMMISDLEIA